MNDTLYISVESVPPTKAGTTLLGVTLSVLPAADPTKATNTISELAKPWNWKITGWTILGYNNSAQGAPPNNWATVATNQSHLLLPTGPTGDDDKGPWAATIAAIKDVALKSAVAKIEASLVGPQNLDPLKLRFSDDQSTVPAAHKYLSLLINLAAGPYPVPQNLNLAFFLEFSAAASFDAYFVAPIFSSGGVVYDSSKQPLPPPGATEWKPTVLGLDMHVEFSQRDTGAALLPSLWLKPAAPMASPLVSNWPAHVYELVGPYLDVAHGILGLPDGLLQKTLPDHSPEWPMFRRWIIACLFDLIHAGLAAPKLSMDDWCQSLRTCLGDYAKLPALNPQSDDAGKSDDEIGALRKIVAAATTERALIALVNEAIGKESTKVVPARLLDEGKAPELLSWLQIELTIPLSQSIADACTVTPVDFDAIATKLCNTTIDGYIRTRATNRYPPFPSDPQKPIPAWVQTLSTACTASFQKPLSTALTRRAFGNDGTGLVAAATTEAAPLVIPALPLRTSVDRTTPDPLRGTRGIGVLMRRTGNPAMGWSSLNIVAPLLASGGMTLPDQGCPMLVANRPGYNQKLLTGFLTYNNGPLPCENLLHNYLADHNRLTHVGGSDPTTDLTAILQYAPYEGAALEFFGTPGLQAGNTYEVACFAVSNAGALPVQLRGAYPAKLKPLTASSVPGSTTADHVVTNLPYFRTVPVGTMEARGEKGLPLNDTSGLFPAAPKSTSLRAIETTVPSRGVSATTSPKAKPSMLLVAPRQSMGFPCAASTASNFKFSLKLPSIEPQTWDRTTGYGLPDQTQRGRILDATYIALAASQKAEITDPLITEVHFKLYRWTINAGAGSWVAMPGGDYYTVAELRKTGPNAMPGVETKAIQVTIDGGSGVDKHGSHGNDGTIKVALFPESSNNIAIANDIPMTNGKSVATQLTEGDVYLLEATYVLGATLASIMPNYQAAANPGYQLLIEFASAMMPDDLVTPFTVQVTPLNGVPDQSLQAKLQADPSTLWKNVSRVDILRQTWYWTGRTQPMIGDVPDATKNLQPGFFPVGRPNAIQEWEKIEFAERPASDHVELATTFQNGVFRWSQDLSLDPRSTYVRLAPRIYNRYQGVFKGTEWYIASSVSTAKAVDRWKTCFVKSRARKLTMPRLKALIPLTESAFAKGTPGILAVFDGPAYEQAGLAERLSVKIAKVIDPDPAIGTEWQQTGPDFLMSSEAVDPNPSKQLVPTLLAIGPIGHTLDADLPSAKFSSHSWIVRPVNPADTGDANPGHDYSWWFADLQFTLGVYDELSVFPGVSLGDQSTTGSWIQFLPGFQGTDEPDGMIDGWSLAWDTKCSQVVVHDAQCTSVTLEKKYERHVRHYLLVTRKVLDVSGTSREAYVGVAARTGKGWTFLSDDATRAAPGYQLRARFLDVRAGEIGLPGEKPPASDADFWQRIIGPKAASLTDENRASPSWFSRVITQKGCSS